MKKLLSVLCVLLVLLSVAAIPVSASRAYQTYTYSINGTALYSPDAYTTQKVLNYADMGLDTPLSNATDVIVDAEQNVYIADGGNNRIVCLDRYYHKRFIIAGFLNGNKIADSLKGPRGVFVTEDRYEGGELQYPGRIYVCDSGNNRIVTFDREGNFISIINKPESEMFGENAVFTPVAMAVDAYDRLYVVSSETSEGVIVMTNKGEFTSFVGAQQSVTSTWAQIIRRFQTKEQRELSEVIISYPYNNIAINPDGFIYVTIYDPGLESKMASAITGKSKSGQYAPCKLLNPAGDEIMRRNGFWPPAGEIAYKAKSTTDSSSNSQIKNVSRVTDVACGPEGTWTIIDRNRNRVFTYDYDGNLLFAFGDSGQLLGNTSYIQAICYQGDSLLMLDGTGTTQYMTVFNRTEYGDVLIQALHHQNVRLYDKAIEDWKDILMRNSNYDAAYVGIGQSLSRNGKYKEALEYYRAAYDTTNYSEAYKEMRKQWMSKFFLLIPVVLIVLIIGIAKFLRHAAKINKNVAVSGVRHRFKDEIYYVFHVIFHPMGGFWDLKHEKRGSVRAALVFMILTAIALFYKSVGIGYVMNPQGAYSTIFMQLLVVFVPILLFAVANWCLTTLFDGEGSFRDIFIACGYSLLPIVLTTVPVTIFSNIVVSNEVDILNLILAFGFIWTGFLLFFGMMVTHDYSMGKNILITLCTIVGMAFIMFLAILFTSLVMDMVRYITNIVTEVNYRI